MNGAMKLFIAGCVAELYLLVIRRFYVNVPVTQMLAWFDYLLYLAIAGAVVCAAGAALALAWRADRKKRKLGWIICGAGAYVGAASGLVRLLNTPALSVMCVLVPVVMLLAILWQLYDRECALSLTILAVTLIVLWICRHLLGGVTLLSKLALAGAVVYLAVLAAAAFLARKADRSGGRLGKLRLLPSDADMLPIYISCGLSFVAVAAAIFSTTLAYYAMWALALVVFVLALYYTVKQL